jgi:hypothetical protein
MPLLTGSFVYSFSSVVEPSVQVTAGANPHTQYYGYSLPNSVKVDWV